MSLVSPSALARFPSGVIEGRGEKRRREEREWRRGVEGRKGKGSRGERGKGEAE